MTVAEKAYIAGIIDGEGSILLTKQSKTQHHSPEVSVASTDVELLEWMKSLIGKGTIIRKKNYNSSKHKNSYAYSVVKDSAIRLLEEILPYLVINKKKARAEHILKKYKIVTVRNGKYNEEQLDAKLKFYKDFVAL